MELNEKSLHLFWEVNHHKKFNLSGWCQLDYELLVEHIFESFEAGNASIFHGRNDLPQVRSQIFLGLPALNDALVAHFMFLLREEQIGFLVGDQFFAFGAFKESVLGVIILIICIFA